MCCPDGLDDQASGKLALQRWSDAHPHIMTYDPTAIPSRLEATLAATGWKMMEVAVALHITRWRWDQKGRLDKSAFTDLPTDFLSALAAAGVPCDSASWTRAVQAYRRTGGLR
jgi:hypothetical protein